MSLSPSLSPFFSPDICVRACLKMGNKQKKEEKRVACVANIFYYNFVVENPETQNKSDRHSTTLLCTELSPSVQWQ